MRRAGGIQTAHLGLEFGGGLGELTVVLRTPGVLGSCARGCALEVTRFRTAVFC